MPVRLTLFSPEEANGLIPFLETRMAHLIAKKRELDQVRNELEVIQLLVDGGASESNPDVSTRPARERRAEELGEEMARALSAVQAKGCVVKDLDLGLVDFYSLRGDRIVFLCWQRGERKVEHWHPLQGGFATRRPIQSKHNS